MNTTPVEPDGARRRPEAGFSLLEVLIAMIVLVFGLVAVANLIAISAAHNMIANQGSAAVSVAIQEMESLKARPFASVPVGLSSKFIGNGTTRPPGEEARGVGTIQVITKVDVASTDPATGAPTTYFLTVIATPINAFNARAAIDPANPPTSLGQAVFTSFRTVEGQ